VNRAIVTVDTTRAEVGMTEPEHPEDREAEEQLAEIMDADAVDYPADAAENGESPNVDSSALFRDLITRRYRA
jgi:hypothetical protein